VRVRRANNQRESSRQSSPGAGSRARGPRVKRARNRRKPDWLRATLLVLLMGLAGECVWAAFNSPRLAVRRIVVAGSRTLSPDQVAAMTGVRLGSNIFRANLYRARKAVQAAPAIRDANVSRLLPDTIAVTLEEREPVLTLAAGTRLFDVDADGVVYREIRQPVRGRAILSLERAPSIGQGQTLDPSVVEAALHCVKLARADGLLLWKITIDAQDDLWLNIKVGGPAGVPGPSLRVRMGRPLELGAKFADARHILRGAPQLAEAAEYLDVSCPRRPAYRVAAGSSESAPGLPSRSAPATGPGL
jgi:cell division septal protein FtsQ